MPNPFVYGEVVPLAAFVDRETELDRLTGDLLAGPEDLSHFPPPLWQVSLVRQALRAAERAGALTVDITVSSYSSYVAFLEGYARRAARASRRESTRRGPGCVTCSARVRPEVRVEADEGGGSQLALSFPSARTERDVSRLAQEVFALPGRIAERVGARWPSPSTNFRRLRRSTAAASSMRFVPRCSISGRSAMCSPVLNRA